MLPMLEQVRNLSRFKVSSQIQNYASLPLVPFQTTIDGVITHTLNPKDLTHFINSAEWNLESAVSTSPSIHFILYIPPKSCTPLQILHSDGKPLTTNAFLIPQWGGIAIKNLDLSSHHVHITDQVLHQYIEVFAGQLRKLMGVEPTRIANHENLLPGFEIKVAQHSNGLTEWELDRLLRKGTIQNIANTISTLQSLSSMLSSLESMIVKDHIRVMVVDSIAALEKVFLITHARQRKRSL